MQRTAVTRKALQGGRCHKARKELQDTVKSLLNAERARTRRRETAKERAKFISNPFHLISFTLEGERSGSLQAIKVEIEGTNLLDRA